MSSLSRYVQIADVDGKGGNALAHKNLKAHDNDVVVDNDKIIVPYASAISISFTLSHRFSQLEQKLSRNA